MTVPTSISIEPGEYAVCRLDADSPLPPLPRRGFVSHTTAFGESSLVCESTLVPEEWKHNGKIEYGFALLRVAGPLAFSEVGILARITDALARAAVSIFAISTFETDYLLISRENVEKARVALERAGITIG